MRYKHHKVSASSAARYRTAPDEGDILELVDRLRTFDGHARALAARGLREAAIGAAEAHVITQATLAAASTASAFEAQIKIDALNLIAEGPYCTSAADAAMFGESIRHEREAWCLTVAGKPANKVRQSDAPGGRQRSKERIAKTDAATDDAADRRPVSAGSIATYARLSRDRRGAGWGVMNLARKVDLLAADMETLHWSGDYPAAAGAGRLLREAMIQLTATPAATPRQLVRKERALPAVRLANSGLPAVAARMISSALASERNAQARNCAAYAAEPDSSLSSSALAFYIANARTASFEAALNEHAGLRHGHAHQPQIDQSGKAGRPSIDLQLEALRPASRNTVTWHEAEAKLVAIQSLGVAATLPTAMLAAAAAFEATKWGLSLQGRPTAAPPGAEAGGDTRQGSGNSASGLVLGPLLQKAELVWGDLEILRGTPGAMRLGCILTLLDISLTVAAIPARDRDEAELKLEYIADLLHALVAEHPLPSAMLMAALRLECAHWDIPLLDLSDDAAKTRH